MKYEITFRALVGGLLFVSSIYTLLLLGTSLAMDYFAKQKEKKFVTITGVSETGTLNLSPDEDYKQGDEQGWEKPRPCIDDGILFQNCNGISESPLKDNAQYCQLLGLDQFKKLKNSAITGQCFALDIQEEPLYFINVAPATWIIADKDEVLKIYGKKDL